MNFISRKTLLSFTADNVKKYIMKFADLHCHLGGSTAPDILKSIAYNRGLSIFPKSWDEFQDLILYGLNDGIEISEDKVERFKDYLNRYSLIQKITSCPDAIRESVFWVLKDAFIHYNCDLIEMKINPMLRNADGIYDLDSIISSACDGVDKAKSIFGIKAGLIIESDRSFNAGLSMILAKKAIKFRDRGVVGFDISGYGEGFCLRDHAIAFKVAKDNGLGVTYHSNEYKFEMDIYNPEILKSIDRIGHGVKIAKSGNQIDAILQTNPNIIFEICPISNITSGVETETSLKSIIQMLHHKKAKFCICTDGFIFNRSVVDNMKRLGMTNKEIFESDRTARDYTFIK